MPKSRSTSDRTRGRLQAPGSIRALPWATILQVVGVLGSRWSALSAKDRARLTGLVRDSRGRLGNLSGRERAELRKLVGRLDVNGTARELASLIQRGRRRR